MLVVGSHSKPKSNSAHVPPLLLPGHNILLVKLGDGGCRGDGWVVGGALRRHPHHRPCAVVEAGGGRAAA